jgi:hypothetical protein
VSSGFYKRRRGILEHIEAGEIDLVESGIHDYLSLKANLLIGSPSAIPVGVCFTSAPAIHAHCKRVSERSIQRCLSHLEEIGWLKTFRAPNQRGNYPALICRASVHDLSGNEYRINADATTDWRHPVYEPVVQASPETSNPVRKVAGLKEERVRNREGMKPAPKPAAPTDARFQPFFAYAFESYRAKHQRAPIWTGKDRTGLKNLLQSQTAAALPLERLRVLWENFSASTEPFQLKQGDSLAYFCSNIDKFSDGPILAVLQKGKSNGRPDTNEAVAATMRGFAINNRLAN